MRVALDDLLFTVVVKGSERYAFFYDQAHADDAVRQMARFALDENLSFTLRDMLEGSQHVREQAISVQGGK